MPVKPILRMGNPFLQQIAKPVDEFNTKDLDRLLQDMRDTMLSAKGVGLAAPQIGVGLRVVIFGGHKSPRYPQEDQIPYTELINPVLKLIGQTDHSDWEGCLSVPGLRGLVPRYHRIEYRGFDPSGGNIERSVDGFHARVLQHECDHLDGILFPQRIEDMRQFGFEEELDI